MSDTPRTDALGNGLGKAIETAGSGVKSLGEFKMLFITAISMLKEHGRTLEREINSLRKQLEIAKDKK
jgi:hypothetical protein